MDGFADMELHDQLDLKHAHSFRDSFEKDEIKQEEADIDRSMHRWYHDWLPFFAWIQELRHPTQQSSSELHKGRQKADLEAVEHYHEDDDKMQHSSKLAKANQSTSLAGLAPGAVSTTAETDDVTKEDVTKKDVGEAGMVKFDNDFEPQPVDAPGTRSDQASTLGTDV